MYEGRTRGKRVKYTYSDDEDNFYSDSTNRRSARNTGVHTPAESGPVTTASGRQIRAPVRMTTGGDDSTAVSVQEDYSEADHEGSVGPTGRPRRSAAANAANGWEETNGGGRGRRGSLNSDDAASETGFGDDEEDADLHVPEQSEEDDEDEFDEDEAMVDDDIEESPKSLVVKLGITPPKLRTALSPIESVPNALPTPDLEDRKLSSLADGRTGVTMPDTPAALETQAESKLKNPVEAKPDLQAGDSGPGATPTSPGAIASAPLAFRGSPEKKHAQPAPMAGILNVP